MSCVGTAQELQSSVAELKQSRGTGGELERSFVGISPCFVQELHRISGGFLFGGVAEELQRHCRRSVSVEVQ